jgi:hypothetical protein
LTLQTPITGARAWVIAWVARSLLLITALIGISPRRPFQGSHPFAQILDLMTKFGYLCA